MEGKLHTIALRWDGAHAARAYLSSDESAVGAIDYEREAEAVVHVRIVSDSAPGYYTAAVELADIDGDPAGVAEWLRANECELVSLHGVRTP